MSKKALVLSGGSVKGAFETGAIKAVLESGFEPDIITGISVGAINGTFAVNEAGRHMRENGSIDWPGVGKNLYDFWLNNIKKPSDIAKKRWVIVVLWHLIIKKFKGISSSAPIDRLIDKTVEIDNLIASGVELAVGCLNMNNGKIVYAEPSNPKFIEFVKGSKAIPFIMPSINIEGNPYLDGGLRDSAPLKTAIRKGATEIVIVLCHSKDLSSKPLNTGNLAHLAERCMSIASNENVNNDISFAEYCNEFLPEDGSPKLDEPFKGYRKLNVKVIRPKTEVMLKIGSFKRADIRGAMEDGYTTARNELRKH